eukprot:TRINITY_DN20109_c0_g1_i1.p1 TRINITY_DN20109_c0_g1~~TRINITY_DN20109_c0_g1_i1.p1  ORF type:complete len:106 (+),score=7.50 TRINITY_DN20109_c0_g1_i1:79-396(+)
MLRCFSGPIYCAQTRALLADAKRRLAQETGGADLSRARCFAVGCVASKIDTTRGPKKFVHASCLQRLQSLRAKKRGSLGLVVARPRRLAANAAFTHNFEHVFWQI